MITRMVSVALVALFTLVQIPFSALAQSFEPVTVLLDPVTFGVDRNAVEVPAFRTTGAVTFRLPNGSYQAVSSGEEIFTHDENGVLVPTDETGKATSNGILFDRLPRGAQVLFDASTPSYTYSQGHHFFRLSFEGIAEPVLESPSVVAYRLSHHAILRFTIDGASIKKTITINGPVDRSILRFTLSQDHALVQKATFDGIDFLTAEDRAVFRTFSPSLQDASGVTLDHPISIVSLGGGSYQYRYDPEGLPETYIIDPTAGPLNGLLFVNDGGFGAASWSNATNAASSDTAYAGSNITSSGHSTNYLKATGMAFSIATGAFIKGITVEVERHRLATFSESVTVKDSRVRIVKTSAIGSTDRSNVNNWATSDPNSYVTYGSGTDLWGETWQASDINNPTGDVTSTKFGVAIAAVATCAGCLTPIGTAMVDHIRVSVTYLLTWGMVCTSGADCTGGSCGICGANTGFNAPCGANPPFTLVCGTHCGGCVGLAGVATLPDGVTAVRASDESYNLSVSPGTSDELVRFKKGSTILADIRMSFSCGNETATVQANFSGQKSYFHISTLDPRASTGYKLYIPKSVSHDRVRICSGAVALGCTSADSWSYYASDQGTIVPNGAFNTTGITSTVADGYWQIMGVKGSGGEGEGSGAGGTTVPEFSAIGLLAVLVSCAYVLRKWILR